MVLWKLRCRSTSPGTQLIARTPNPLCIIHDGENHAWNHWCAHTELNTINFKDDKILFVCSYTQHKNINLSFIYYHYYFFKRQFSPRVITAQCQAPLPTKLSITKNELFCKKNKIRLFNRFGLPFFFLKKNKNKRQTRGGGDYHVVSSPAVNPNFEIKTASFLSVVFNCRPLKLGHIQLKTRERYRVRKQQACLYRRKGI